MIGVSLSDRLDAEFYWQNSSTGMQSDKILSLENGGVLDQSDANRQGVMEYKAWKVKFK